MAARRRRRRPVWRAWLLATAIVVVTVVLVTHHGGHPRTTAADTSSAAASSHAAGGGSASTAATTGPSTTAGSSTAAGSSTTAGQPTTSTAPASSTTTTVPSPLPPSDNGTLAQTTTEPSTQTAVFQAEMRLLWDAIRTDKPAEALPAFFPEPAYLQVKALSNDAADWTDRLEAHFLLDVEAAHALLGAGASSAQLVGVQADAAYAAWVPPGACYNNLGYWHLPGSRMVYQEGGQVRSFGVLSLISWRGIWYVVHLGALDRSSDTGMVDSPTVGPGTPGPPGGC